MAIVLLFAIVLTVQLALVMRFGLPVIFEMTAVACALVWFIQPTIDPSVGPNAALLAAIPAWQIGLTCAGLALAYRLVTRLAPWVAKAERWEAK